ncbi:MAG: hypothetical protein LBQ88_05080 [Treponema sp.]|jgi:hypothetical protein|nr:hypothetical protein [Treponema sp.]
MNNFRKQLLFVLTVAALLGSCDLSGGNGESGDPNVVDGVDYTDYNSGYSIQVRNETNKDLVAFKGNLSAETLIGGIPAGVSQHGLKKDATLFNDTTSFTLTLITKEDYAANKNKLQTLQQTPFTRLFAFYNAAGTNDNVFTISGHLGGTNTLIIQNRTNYNVEIRVGGVTGETLGFVQPQTSTGTTFFVDSRDFDIYPVFKRYNPLRDEMLTIFPKGATDLPWYTSISLGEADQTTQTLNVSSILSEQDVTTGAAWLVINNQSTDTGVQLMRGDTPIQTASGITTINRTYSRTFQIDMPKAGNTYASSVSIAGYTVGRSADGKPIGTGTHTLEIDKMYMVTVTGSANADTLSVSKPVFQADVDLDDFDVTQ